jgi:3D-(3,5/4)-trihydroxycyclohexane-1,2-dione acylhydrolase (decyclizing)
MLAQIHAQIKSRALIISGAGGLTQALKKKTLPSIISVSVSEAIVLGLLKQGVSKYLAIFGHGSTDLANILRIYEAVGIVKTYNFRNEVAMAHAASALKWQYAETAAVVTSIGPGAMQAMAGSLVAASNGLGVYHIYGDETTHGEGYNMQQIPKLEQGLYSKMTSILGDSYVLHTPESMRDALRRGTLCVNHPYKAGPFYFLLPMNIQNKTADFNLSIFPEVPHFPEKTPIDKTIQDQAINLMTQYDKIVIKAGGGCLSVSDELTAFAESIGAAVVVSPKSTGVIPDDHPQNCHVGGSKGSISGNFAMENAELLIAIGTRAVCQSDCSGIGYKSAKAVININGDISDSYHYHNTFSLNGNIPSVLSQLVDSIKKRRPIALKRKKQWLEICFKKKKEWQDFKESRYKVRPLEDPAFGKPLLTQPVAINAVAKFAKSIDATKIFDAGDVQANGFQIVEDDKPGETINEAGASYMGFAVSALVASGIAENPKYSIAFSGDGSFMMNPQVLIDAVEHDAFGMIVLFDNRRMAAISGLQIDQYQSEFKTNDSVEVDYIQLASSIKGIATFDGGHSLKTLNEALYKAHNYKGLSLVYIPVYAGKNEQGGMGAYGSWNVGNWCEAVQAKYLKQNI